ncbi:hypothetical protein DFH07DRAFT_777190 [Mycena maculata]|uniref:Uncharacterized protein n=1 Tax=Mycena maculata TaxID=230809 RepID=A0AAD7N4G2_9AGAR|nr:hypothetical protein DFH07DRAFT_777190 [Mycena maculata]
MRTGVIRAVLKRTQRNNRFGVEDQAQRNGVKYLPVFYANLDPAMIPSGDQLEIHSTFTEGAVHRALISLRSIYFMTHIPSSAFRELWPSVWKWVQFFDMYYDSIKVVGIDVDEVTGGDFILFTVDHPHSGGAGGTLSDLAALVIGYIDGVSSCLTAQQPDTRLRVGIFEFTEEIDRSLSHEDLHRHALGPFTEALISAGIIKSLTTMSCTITKPKTRFPGFPPLLERSLIFLSRTLHTSADHLYVLDVVECGILRDIITCATAGNFNQGLALLLEHALPPSLISCYVLSSLRRERFRVRARFSTLAEERIAILFNSNAQRRQLFKAYDNVKSANNWIGGRVPVTMQNLVKLVVPVASAIFLPDLPPREPLPFGIHQPFGVRQRSFMRALLTQDYHTGKCTTIYPQQAIFMAHSLMEFLLEGIQSLCSLDIRFSNNKIYTMLVRAGGRVKIDVQPLLPSSWTKYFGSKSEWHDEAGRAPRANGRMDLHVMAIRAAGTQTQYLMVPLRTETPRLQSEVWRIAMTLDLLTPFPQLVEAIRGEMERGEETELLSY